MAGRNLDTVAGETKGVLLAVASLDGGEVAFAAMGEGERDRCSEAWATLGRLDQGGGSRLLERWRAELATGLPSGLERLHATWIEGALAGESAYLLELLRDCLPDSFGSAVEKLLGRTEPSVRSPASPGLRHDLARIAFAHLAPLCENDGGPLAARLGALTLDGLEREITTMGARTLARSLAGSDAAVRAGAMAVTGDPWATVMAQAFGQAVSDDERKAAVVQVAATVVVVAHTPSERLLHIGLATLAAELAAEHPGSRFRVAGRLPAELGRRLLGW